MRNQHILIILALVSSVCLSCQSKLAPQNATPSSTPFKAETKPSNTNTAPAGDTSIRKADFENFTYPKAGAVGPIKLVDAKDAKSGAKLEKIEYGDVTKDGTEEAMVIVDPHTSNDTASDIVYVFTPEKGQPKLLWSFATGDRAKGGYKRVYAEGGSLIVELFGEDKYDNGQWHFDIPADKFKGLCCPTLFTKFRFDWNGHQFALAGEPQTSDYDPRKP